MDPISAFSLFCNVVQTVEVAVKTGQTLVELYNSSTGFPRDSQTLLSATGSLKDSIRVLKSAQIQLHPLSSGTSSTTPSGMQVASVAAECATSVDKIEALLDKCKVKKKSSILAAGSAIFRARKYKSELMELQKEMEASRENLKMAIAVATRTELMLLKSQFQTFGQHQTKISKSLDDISGQLQSSSDIRRLVDGIKNSLAVSEEALEEVNHNAILQALRPASASTRFDEINDPDADTFEWIFQHPEKLFEFEPTLEYSLPDWLTKGSGIFHIAGKPGSGKSTLLKFVAQHTETRSLLEDWAQQAGKQLIFSKFFFWKMASVEQRTLRGMIRGLVYDVTRHYPGITKVLFPNHWNPHSFLFPLSRSREIKFDQRDITAAFDTLVNSPEVFDRFRICIFLDGLDEFDEKDISHWELATTLLKWTTDPSDRTKEAANIKLCVSSRELPSIISSFPECQRITLHNLTSSDITNLIQARLGNNKHFQLLASTDSTTANALLEAIARQSSGVFLWVVLLLKLLVEELASGESSLCALECIVKSSIGELDEFFEMILNSIPRHQRRGAYVVFAMMVRCCGLHLIPHDEDRDPAFEISLFGLFCLFEGFDRATEAVPSSSVLSDVSLKPCRSIQDYESCIRKTSVDLKSRCKGLVDVKYSMEIGDDFKNTGWATAIFTHRSVAEFLLDKLRNKQHDLAFTDDNISQYLIWMTLCEVRLLFHPADLQTPLVNKRVLILLWIVRSRPIVSRDTLQLLDDMDSSMLEYHRLLKSTPSALWGYPICFHQGYPYHLNLTSYRTYHHFTTLAAWTGHHEFLAWKIAQDPLFKKDRERLSGVLFGALVGVLRMFPIGQQTWLSHHVKTLRIALDSGILSAQLLDHIFPATIPDQIQMTLDITAWLDFFDHSTSDFPGHQTCRTDFTLETICNLKPRISPWRSFLMIFVQLLMGSKRGQVFDQLWQCLEYWLDAGVPIPTLIYLGYRTEGLLEGEIWMGIKLRSYCHRHQREELQVTSFEVPRLNKLVDSRADIRRVSARNCQYLSEKLRLFGHDIVKHATLESFVRYHRPSNMDRLLELIGRQIPLCGGHGSDPESIWDLQRIIEEAPNSR